MASELRFGIIGCNDLAMEMCAGISAAANTTIVMLMDPRPAVLDEWAMIYAAAVTTDLETVLSNPQVDAVYIASDPHVRTDQGIQAAQAGKHVLIETPMALTLADADALIAACRKHHVKLGWTNTARVDAGITAARDLVRSGLLGQITGVRMQALLPRIDPLGGGVLMGSVLRDLDTVGWVAGLEATRVYAEYSAQDATAERVNMAGLIVRYRQGAIGVIQAGAPVPGGAHKDLPGPRIYGTKGQIVLGPTPLVYWIEPPEGGAAGTWQEIHFDGRIGDNAELVYRFAAAVMEDREPPAAGVEGRKALEIVLAAHRAGELGQAVTLPLG